ncbi:unnamed protein product [Pieris brassicae]|uniref:Attacin C-terminal domain-containing protein n=1 Tax=Pieris brassicae TaxID=7116 RepID=A0A9P0TJQ3_PIEBR|nr:unnamed protein product [Pieris brassicae]
MSLTGNASENADKTKNYLITGTKENCNNTMTANAFVSGYRDTPDPTKLGAPHYSVAGGSLTVESRGHSASVAAQHIPNFGDRVTGSANLNLINSDKHKLDAHGFSTQTIPKAHPNFATHGAGVDYTYMNKHGASASVTHTPMFNKTDHNLGAHFNLHKTPNSSLDLNVGASKSKSPFSNGNWDKQGSFIFRKEF